MSDKCGASYDHGGDVHHGDQGRGERLGSLRFNFQERHKQGVFRKIFAAGGTFLGQKHGYLWAVRAKVCLHQFDLPVSKIFIEHQVERN